MLGIMALILPFPLGPLAWRLGRKDLKAMQDGEMDPNGMDLTTYGTRFGMASTVLGILCFVVPVFYFYTLMKSINQTLEGVLGGGNQPGQSVPGLQLPGSKDLEDLLKGH
jgi:hypothetical protein